MCRIIIRTSVQQAYGVSLKTYCVTTLTCRYSNCCVSSALFVFTIKKICLLVSLVCVCFDSFGSYQVMDMWRKNAQTTNSNHHHQHHHSHDHNHHHQQQQQQASHHVQSMANNHLTHPHHQPQQHHSSNSFTQPNDKFRSVQGLYNTQTGRQV